MYYLFILLIGAERLVELAVSRRNAAGRSPTAAGSSAAGTTR